MADFFKNVCLCGLNENLCMRQREQYSLNRLTRSDHDHLYFVRNGVSV